LGNRRGHAAHESRRYHYPRALARGFRRLGRAERVGAAGGEVVQLAERGLAAQVLDLTPAVVELRGVDSIGAFVRVEGVVLVRIQVVLAFVARRVLAIDSDVLA